ncbi:hypothetical protein [Blastococcus mobilis]|uniref:hypothetical protein n=1 Tax=Blastococcus mobilis TaxID=1938746 RepID=UPI001131836F|nr:hypothetical protein [Blastococcus mobilis]
MDPDEHGCAGVTAADADVVQPAVVPQTRSPQARRTPGEAYRARPKAAATGIPLINGHFRVRHDTIDSNRNLTDLNDRAEVAQLFWRPSAGRAPPVTRS